MIEYLSGRLLSSKPFHAVVVCGGVGYGVEIPLSVTELLPRVGSDVELYIHMHVQEDAIRLYGFLSEKDREMFDLIISVSGVGPRTAIMILSEMKSSELANAIVTEDLQKISKVKGIGRKTAEKMIVELREKMVKFLRVIPAASMSKNDSAAAASDSPDAVDDGTKPVATSQIADAIDALVALDCKYAVAEKSVVKAAKELGSDATLDALIRLALRYR
ncbi:Holliday junction branch migration protein RuvA [Candidatus Sumerlaeota bacterium]|nr:Holliday junction branch migration protein RuvA [Candidatus Sumerlaeota bacterium]